MSTTINKVILAGRLGAEATQIGGQDGKKTFARLRVATSRPIRKTDGEGYDERTEWHTVVIFNEHLAKRALENFKKGDLIQVDGELRYSQYEKEGVKTESAEIVVESFNGTVGLLARAGTGSASSGSSSESNEGGSDQSSSSDKQNDLNDDIPF